MRQNAEYQKFNLFRQPDWRWGRVLQLCDKAPTPGRCTTRDDAYVRAARTFLLRWRAFDATPERREELFWENQGLYYAFEIHDRSLDEPDSALLIQARVLARQTPEEIGKSMGITPDTVTWYEALFFNVLDRINQHDWITKQVLLPAAVRNVSSGGHVLAHGLQPDARLPIGNAFYDMTLKFFAYFGGGLIVDFMLTGFQTGNLVGSPDQVGQYFERHLSLNLKRRAAQAVMTFDVNQFNLMELFAVTTKIMELERAAESEDNAKTTIEKHVLGMIQEIPWLHGDRAKQALKETQLGIFDDGSAELRDEEVLAVSAKMQATGLEGLEKFELPPDNLSRKRQELAPPVKQSE